LERENLIVGFVSFGRRGKIIQRNSSVSTETLKILRPLVYMNSLIALVSNTHNKRFTELIPFKRKLGNIFIIA